MKTIFAIATTTVGEAIRRRVLLVILLVGLVFMMIAPGLSALSARQETTVLTSFMLGILQLTSAVIAIVLTVYMIPNEIERRTIYTILSKPVQRWQFLLGKYFGAVLALGLMMALMSFVLILVFMYQQGLFTAGAAGFAKVADIARAPLVFFVQMSLLSAVAIFFSTFVSPIVNFFLSGGVFLLGSMFFIVFETIGENKNTSAFVKLMANAVNMILPNFNYFNVQNPIINPGSVIVSEQQYYLKVTSYGLIYIALLLMASIIIFDRREV